VVGTEDSVGIRRSGVEVVSVEDAVAESSLFPHPPAITISRPVISSTTGK
jgi:hypothetical protein